MSERAVDAGRAISHGIYAPIARWTESDELGPMFEKPPTAQVVRNKIEAVSLDSTSMVPSLGGPLLADIANWWALSESRPHRHLASSSFF